MDYQRGGNKNSNTQKDLSCPTKAWNVNNFPQNYKLTKCIIKNFIIQAVFKIFIKNILM